MIMPSRSRSHCVTACRGGVQALMSRAPLAGHIDHKDQYVAFVDLLHFGLQAELGEDRLVYLKLSDLSGVCLDLLCSS